MYFVRYKTLKEELTTHSLTDREALPYLIATSVIAILVITLTHERESDWEWLFKLTEVSLAVFGTLYCFRNNGGKEGHDFILKFLVLGWITLCRCVLLFIPITFLYVYGLDFLYAEYTFTTVDFIINEELVDLGIFLIFTSIFYLHLGKHLRDTCTLLNKEAGAGAYEKHMINEQDAL